MALRDLAEQLAEQQAEDGEDFEIEVVDDRPEEDRREPADLAALDEKEDLALSDEEMQALSSRAQQRIRHLTWRMNEERRQREQALREKQEAMEHAKRLQGQTQQQISQYQKALLERQKALTTVGVQQAQAALAAAAEEGDPQKVAEAQTKLTQAIMAQGQTEQFAHQYASQVKEKADSAPAQQPPSQIERPPLSDTMKDWMAKNPWFTTDRPKTAYALGLHEELVMKGLQPETPEYFAEIDRQMKAVFPGINGNGQATQQAAPPAGSVEVDTADTPAPQRRMTPVAPTRGRRAPSGSPGKVTLTRTEVETARQLGVPLKEYAKQKRALEAQNG